MPLDFQVSTKGVISDNDTILILKGNSKKFRQTCWDLPGGRMEPGETLSETLKREVEEELPGAHVTKIGQLFYAEANHHRVDDRELLTLFYFISIKV
ncbi:NUDIX domain-containing protein, partial [Patescibacteria group bacterium]|nr:NUDIX domain-containing protein [Patescibacteria group bacterium]